jgi:hypothetical protein
MPYKQPETGIERPEDLSFRTTNRAVVSVEAALDVDQDASPVIRLKPETWNRGLLLVEIFHLGSGTLLIEAQKLGAGTWKTVISGSFPAPTGTLGLSVIEGTVEIDSNDKVLKITNGDFATTQGVRIHYKATRR